MLRCCAGRRDCALQPVGARLSHARQHYEFRPAVAQALAKRVVAVVTGWPVAAYATARAATGL